VFASSSEANVKAIERGKWELCHEAATKLI
jgi:hypothetical protein